MSPAFKINFITNLDPRETSGGWTGINAALYGELSKYFDLYLVGPINPPPDYPAKLVSKLKRVNGHPGTFHFFSDKRLRHIAQLVEKEVDTTAAFDFFHGSTPWIHYNSPRAYYLYVDTCFSTYVDVYHERRQFTSDDLKRIYDAESHWLARASGVFFGTQWALDQVVADYAIGRSNLAVVGTGGSLPIPDKDEYDGGFDFLFIALDFEQKGGHICAEAFAKVHQQFPEARLKLIGARPPDEIASQPGVSYEGFLNKAIPAEFSRLRRLYAKAFALIHPTSSDIQPLVITEAGYFGCPSIAANSFGIPELVDDGVTGILIDTPLTAEAFASQMLGLWTNASRYREMRIAVRQKTTTQMTWEAVGQRVARLMLVDADIIHSEKPALALS